LFLEGVWGLFFRLGRLSVESGSSAGGAKSARATVLLQGE
jgi:hypothetical protein